jgi:glucokinase
MNFKEEIYVQTMPRDITCLMGADIGGTNSNFGIFNIDQKKPVLLLALHAKSQEITDFPGLVKEVLSYLRAKYNITIKNALFAAAGVVSENRDYAQPTNLSIAIDAAKIKEATGLTSVCVVNDFEVIGYGLHLIDPKDLVLVNEGKPKKYANKLILGAGTGLGQCIMYYNHSIGRYMPMASEGGHADFPAQHMIEIDLMEFIKKSEKKECNVSWEDLLSGTGIQRIYQFFHSRANGGNHAPKDRLPNPDEIFTLRNDNQHSKDTFQMYTRFYGRCAKDFALNSLALGGVYIAGGIAAKNLPLFELPAFMNEFINCGKQQNLLKQIPVSVITDYNVSLYGAAEYMILENSCEL